MFVSSFVSYLNLSKLPEENLDGVDFTEWTIYFCWLTKKASHTKMKVNTYFLSEKNEWPALYRNIPESYRIQHLGEDRRQIRKENQIYFLVVLSNTYLHLFLSSNYCAFCVVLSTSMEYKKKIHLLQRSFKSGLRPNTTVIEVSRWKNKDEDMEQAFSW